MVAKGSSFRGNCDSPKICLGFRTIWLAGFISLTVLTGSEVNSVQVLP